MYTVAIINQKMKHTASIVNTLSLLTIFLSIIRGAPGIPDCPVGVSAEAS